MERSLQESLLSRLQYRLVVPSRLTQRHSVQQQSLQHLYFSLSLSGVNFKFLLGNPRRHAVLGEELHRPSVLEQQVLFVEVVGVEVNHIAQL